MSNGKKPAPGPVAKKTIETAKGFIGTQEEGGNNSGFQVERFLKSVGLGAGNPWCAAFVRHCIEKSAGFIGAAIPASFPDSGYVPDFERWAREHGLWIPVSEARDLPDLVQPGDLGLFFFAAKGRTAHIGIVVDEMDGGVVMVEGNTSSETGVNRDGDGVFRKHRRWSQFGARGGFVRLNF